MSKPLLEKLIQEIAMFDMVAAFTLYCRVGIEDYKDKDDLAGVMGWSDTPEGHKWWDAIYNKLEARREKYHPHRDLMIEYGNDKTIKIEILIDNKWQAVKDPVFSENLQYRKKQESTKKVIECRIYLDAEDEIHITERQDTNPPHLKKWLGDWQKVEVEV